jgi:hypothetical protein
MRHEIVWQGTTGAFDVKGEGEPFTVIALPAVIANVHGVTVGLYYSGPDSFGHWESSNVCDAVTAWRVAQILPKVKTVREQGYGYDTTLAGLVIAMNGDRNEDRIRERSADLGMSVEEFVSELEKLTRLWPSSDELFRMWDHLPARDQEDLARIVRGGFDSGYIDRYEPLEERVEAAERRLRDAADRMAQEEQLIKDGLAPHASLRLFLEDIGVKNLRYTVGIGEMFDPTHIAWENLDREVMRELIGERGFSSRITLLTTALQPDDPSAHHSEGGGAISVYWSSFGESGHPRIQLSGITLELISVAWDATQGELVLTYRPVGLSERDSSQDAKASVAELRSQIGFDLGLERPLLVGEKPAWAMPLSPTTRSRRRLLGWRH